MASFLRPGSTLPVPQLLLLVLALLCGLLALGLMAGTPIVVTDADLWFHLSHGQQIVETGEIPDHAYFSFLEPGPRPWVDYSWLHQWTVFHLFDLGGYGALIAYRTLQLALTLGLLGFCLLRPAQNQLPPFQVLLFLLVAWVLTETFLGVRPHATSYLMITLFVTILEFAPRALPVLPLAGLVWVNSHGVEFPVLLALVGAYLLDLCWQARERRFRLLSVERRAAFWMILTLATVFFTPHGLALVEVPFLSTAEVSEYIVEMRRLEWRELVEFSLGAGGLSRRSAFNLLLWTALFVAWSRRREGGRLAHIILAMAALVLLAKGQRFLAESALLLVPFLAARAEGKGAFGVVGGLTVGVAGGIALALLQGLAYHRHASFPVSNQALPTGTAAFLQSTDAGGRVLNHPNYGGYLLWALPDRYEVALDLEIPFLFSDEQFYRVRAALYDAPALAGFLSEYDPGWLAVPLEVGDFPRRLTRHGDYVPVAFDDVQVLYVDRVQFPEIAAGALRSVDPWAIHREGWRPEPSQEEAVLLELEELAARAPGSRILPRRLAEILLRRSRYSDAVAQAEELLRVAPEESSSHLLLGDIRAATGDFESALQSFQTALDRARDRGDSEAKAHRRLGLVHLRLGQDSLAWKHLRQVIPPFDPQVPFRDLVLLGQLTAGQGSTEEAIRFLRLARIRIPPEDTATRQEVDRLLRELGDGS